MKNSIWKDYVEITGIVAIVASLMFVGLQMRQDRYIAVAVGRESHFFYRPESIEQVRTYLDTVSMQWDEALSRLKTLVES